MTYLFVLERWIFLKARFIAKICQNFNWEPLLDSMVFFLVLFGHMNRDVSFVS